MKYAIHRHSSPKWVASFGGERAYTKCVADAELFETRSEAEKHKCGNEAIIGITDLWLSSCALAEPKMDTLVTVYCTECKEPCRAFVDDERDCVEWWITCACPWQKEPSEDTIALEIMDEKARMGR